MLLKALSQLLTQTRAHGGFAVDHVLGQAAGGDVQDALAGGLAVAAK
jgi:hypothetical protein